MKRNNGNLGQEPLELLIEIEYPPIFPDAVPHSYLDARKEYAGKYAYPFVWRNFYTCYHPECMKMVIANRCKAAHTLFTEEDLNRWVYNPEHQYGAQFIRIKDARSYLKRCVWLPPWCQYCIKFFW